MLRLTIALSLIALVAPALAACGDEDDGSAAGASRTEEAFLKGMIPHHESAVEMAEVAGERGQHTEVEELARAIIKAQSAEISQMEEIYRRLTGEEIAPDPAAHEQLGLSLDDAGMHEGGAMMLEAATKEFDRVFIDEMIPHHQGAIRQARIVVADAEDAEIRELAKAIVAGQSREIEDMNRWRKRWYGTPSPAGGVPSEREQLPPSSDDRDDHDSEH